MTRPKQSQNKNDSSKTIADIAKKFTKKIDLQKKILELMETVDAQDETIDLLTKELTKLKLEDKATDVFEGGLPTNDKFIAEVQLNRLKEAALGRDLTLEEARKFEIFSKIKNASSNEKPKEKPALPKDVTPSALKAIASSKSNKPNE